LWDLALGGVAKETAQINDHPFATEIHCAMPVCAARVRPFSTAYQTRTDGQKGFPFEQA
jgi:hypothetical protein